MVHFDGPDTHSVRIHESAEHRREKAAWIEAAESAGYAAQPEVTLNTGCRPDVVIYGPAANVGIEVQRYHLTVPSVKARTTRIAKGDVVPIWSTDHQTDWTDDSAVPHVRTNPLPEHTIRDGWLVVAGIREQVAEEAAGNLGSFGTASAFEADAHEGPEHAKESDHETNGRHLFYIGHDLLPFSAASPTPGRRAFSRITGSASTAVADVEDAYEAVLAEVPDDPGLARWMTMARERIAFQGLPARICWLGYGQRHRVGLRFNELVRTGKVKAPIVIGRDHLDSGSVASPNRETEGMRDGSDAIADWAILNALVNTAAGATWVSFHHGGGVGMGFSQHAGMVIVCDGSKEAAQRLERVLTNDPATGVMRHADAGYEIAQDFAREKGLNLPMLGK